MTTFFVVSTVLLIVFIGARHFEYARGNTRVLEKYRAQLDSLTIRGIQKFLSGIKNFLDYIHKDIFLSGLHMVTYVALLIVRQAEKKLEQTTFFLRSFRRREQRKKFLGK